MTISVGIIGAGIVGRLLAFKAAARGWRVTLFERGPADGSSACSAVSPAMLAPYCELDVSEKNISDLGAQSLRLWPEILREMDIPVFFQQAGTLVVAHPQDIVELEHFSRGIKSRMATEVFRSISHDELATLEPDLDRRFQNALFFPSEGQIDSRSALAALLNAAQTRGANCQFNTEATAIRPHEIDCNGETHKFDMVFDCRGYGASLDIKNLRAVRGEIIRVYAPDVNLNRPVRLLHSRWPLYVVPRPDNHYIIGATMIESEDHSPIALRSLLEMLNAAFALSAGFSEARVWETATGLRPAFPDNEPRILHEDGLIRINGMYRHGFLLAPILIENACQLAEGKTTHAFAEAA